MKNAIKKLTEDQKKKAENLVKEISNLETKVTNTDPLGLTSDPKFNTNLRFVETLTSGGTLCASYYRKDGFVLDQDKYIFDLIAGIREKLPPSSEHHLTWPPDRVCNGLNCGSCTVADISNHGNELPPCMINQPENKDKDDKNTKQED